MQEMSEKMEEDPTFASIDVTTVFKSVDKDRSGAITFSELLRMMYPYTSKARLTEMLKFVAQQDIKPLSKKEDVLTDEQTQELKEIFELCVDLFVVTPFYLQFSIARHSTTH
mmetsp:Transcript_10774/g.28246  ORF Transcript_10774/g.28246 Transcript_10774/m.28246 type:complete len:112 (-) Transcript_10774:737-1072(-)